MRVRNIFWKCKARYQYIFSWWRLKREHIECIKMMWFFETNNCIFVVVYKQIHSQSTWYLRYFMNYYLKNFLFLQVHSLLKYVPCWFKRVDMFHFTEGCKIIFYIFELIRFPKRKICGMQGTLLAFIWSQIESNKVLTKN